MQQELHRFEDVWAVLRQRWALLIGVVVLSGAGAAGVSSLQPAEYQADTLALIQNRAAAEAAGRSMDPGEVATQAAVVQSDAVAEQVRSDLGLEVTNEELLDTVSVEPVEGKRVLVITATWPSAEGAADVSNAFAESYLELAEDRARAAQEAITDSYVGRISDVQGQISSLRRESRSATGNQEAEIEAQIQSLISRQAELQASLLLADDPSTVTSGGIVLRPAETPSSASAPRPLRAGVLGGVLGFIVGLMVFYMRDRTSGASRHRAAGASR